MDKIKSGPLRKNSLLEANPGAYILNRVPLADHRIGRKIPVRIPDGNGDDNPFGFGYFGKFVQHFRVRDSLIGDAGAQSIMEGSQTNILGY